jgi:hypothetical protein
MGKKCNDCFYFRESIGQKPCSGCWSNDDRPNWTPSSISIASEKQLPSTIKLSIEEYMETLGLPEQGLNGTTAEDLYNVISKPKHYMLFAAEDLHKDQGIEVRDVIAKLVSKLRVDTDSGMFVADYVQLLQYIMRFMDKNGVEDLKKARWYLDKMIEAY